ncbi:hypothetical protein POL82_04290 [Priestia aryabhattai]|uniref:hypothetical protein n=1 Tax=Priestia TaxID=2800373 RepID=UPI00234FA466|nr:MULTISPECIES: hypothetical protein [Priestia]MDC7762668.1 hypothetical protein [Priestia aryabhattai]MED3980876.1 hypothetical protein [Priestia megaterium]
MKVVFIQSVSVSIQGTLGGQSYPYSYVFDLPDATANDYINNKKWAIPFDGWETNPQRPVNIKFPK